MLVAPRPERNPARAEGWLAGDGFPIAGALFERAIDLVGVERPMPRARPIA
jgi:hypothetical protein